MNLQQGGSLQGRGDPGMPQSMHPNYGAIREANKMETLGEGWRSRYWALLAILGMVVALVFTVPAIDALGQEDGVTITEDAGIILLSSGTSGNNWIRYYAEPNVPNAGQSFQQANPTPTKQQALQINSRCTVTSDDSILELDYTNGRRIAMVSNGLGVGSKNNCSTSEGRITGNEGQTMTFSLADVELFDDVFIEAVEADVEAKFGTDLDFIVSHGTETATGTFDLVKGQDNGPDAGTGDNEIATIDQELAGMLFSSITLFPTNNSAEISIEGGGDGSVEGGTLRTLYKANHTLFKLVSVKTFDAGDLSCGGTSTGTADAHQDGPADAIQLWRGDNLKSEECLDLAYSFRIESDVVLFDANFETQPDAQFLIKIEWDPSDPVVDPFNPPDRQIDVDFDGNFDPVEACDGRNVGDDPDADPSADPSIDDTFEHPDNTPWCLAGEKLVLLEDGSWQQIQWYHGEGEDPQFR